MGMKLCAQIHCLNQQVTTVYLISSKVKLQYYQNVTTYTKTPSNFLPVNSSKPRHQFNELRIFCWRPFWNSNAGMSSIYPKQLTRFRRTCRFKLNKKWQTTHTNSCKVIHHKTNYYSAVILKQNPILSRFRHFCKSLNRYKNKVTLSSCLRQNLQFSSSQ